MAFTMTWRFGGAASVDPTPILTRTGEPSAARVGDVYAVSSPAGLPCYVQVCLPGTEGYDRPFVEVDAYNPVPLFTLGYQHQGMKVRIVAKGLDSNGLPNGVDYYSNEIGPVLHAVDPVGVTVSNQAQLWAEMDAGTPLIVLAAGTTWDVGSLNRAYSNGRITTPQGNPARFVDSVTSITATWSNVILDGLVIYGSAGWSPGKGVMLTLGSNVSDVTLRAVRQYGDNVAPAVYQAVPAEIGPGLGYWGTGMDFMPYGISTRLATRVTIEGHHARNVFWPFILGPRTRARHIRAHGWYFDVIQWNGGAGSTDYRDVRDFYVSDCYGVYNELSASAPHCDPFQFSATGDALNVILDGYMNCIGDTRAYAFGGTVTNHIANSAVRRGRYRRAVATGQGSINWYQLGADNQLDYVTKVSFGTAEGSLRFTGTTEVVGQGEARISRSILRGNVLFSTFGAKDYYVNDGSAVNVGADIQDYIKGDPAARPATLADLALMARPQPGHADKGALLESGHMRPFEEFPETPAITPTPVSGGFDIVLSAVAGAEAYGIRYRQTGTTGAWITAFQPSEAFSTTGLGSAQNYDLQSWVKTDAGLSNWSAVQVVATS